jgi:hypothetical protein
MPTRGQVGAVRASVSRSELGWVNSWNGGGGGWEYWFPRYQDSDLKNPLIILGGARQRSGGRLETWVADDSELNPLVSRALREFLPGFLPGQFVDAGADSDAWEMEWVCELFFPGFFSLSFLLCSFFVFNPDTCLFYFHSTDGHNGVYKNRESIRMFPIVVSHPS